MNAQVNKQQEQRAPAFKTSMRVNKISQIEFIWIHFSFWVHLGTFGYIWVHLGTFGYTFHFGYIWVHFSFGYIWVHLGTLFILGTFGYTFQRAVEHRFIFFVHHSIWGLKETKNNQ